MPDVGFLWRGFALGGGQASSVVSECNSLLLSLVSEGAFMSFGFDDVKGARSPSRIRILRSTRSTGIVSDRPVTVA